MLSLWSFPTGLWSRHSWKGQRWCLIDYVEWISLVYSYIIHSFSLCVLSPKEDRLHIAPSLSSCKTNKDVKHQSRSWLIKEDLKYFPLCLTWVWVSPTRGITTRIKWRWFFLLLLLLWFCVTEVKHTKLEPVLWSCWLQLFKGSLSLPLSLFSISLQRHQPAAHPHNTLHCSLVLSLSTLLIMIPRVHG